MILYPPACHISCSPADADRPTDAGGREREREEVDMQNGLTSEAGGGGGGGGGEGGGRTLNLAGLFLFSGKEDEADGAEGYRSHGVSQVRFKG